MLCRVSPFGNPGIDTYVRFPQAYRSLSRPSSAPDAKAFPLRSFQLDLKLIQTRFGSQELCRPQSFGFSLLCYPLFKATQKFVTFSVACSYIWNFFLIVQFSRCRLRFPLKPDTSIQALNACICLQMVEIIGLEPMTPCLQSRCSPS